jgi:hypothetical protein
MQRRAVLGAVAAAALLAGRSPTKAQTPLVKISVAFAGQNIPVTLFDNASAREFADMLPLDLTISDYSTNEKIAYLPRKLSDLAWGPVDNPAPGDLCYYVPWGNLAFFHGSYQSIRDLVRLGRLDGGVEPLLVRGEFPLRITLA